MNWVLKLETKQLSSGAWNQNQRDLGEMKQWTLQKLQLSQDRLQCFPIDNGLVACPGIKKHHVSLRSVVSILYPRCLFHKQIFSAGLLLFYWNSFLCKSDIKICYCLDTGCFKDIFLVLRETLVMNTNNSTAIAQQTSNKEQLTYELEWSYLLRRNVQWDRILYFLRKQFITIF